MKVAKFIEGQSFVNNDGCVAKIISFEKGTKYSPRKAWIQFEDGTIIKVSTPKLTSGSFKNPNKPFVYGVGFIGIGNIIHLKITNLQKHTGFGTLCLNAAIVGDTQAMKM